MVGVIAAAVPLQAAPSAAPGCGRLRVIQGRGRSVVSHAYATSPLRLLTPANPGHAAWVYTSSYGGGLVDGDRIVLDVEVGAGAAAFLSTQASTKAYRSPRGTTAELRARVEPGGLLVVAPDPVVCFAASKYRQAQRFDVARDASLVVVDWMSSGRRATGERWAFSEYAALLSVRLEDRLLVHDTLVLRADHGDLAARMGRFDVIAVAVVIGTALRTAAAGIVAQVSGMALACPPKLDERRGGRRADRLLAATPLGDAGCVVRIAGTSVEQVGRTIRELLGFVPALLGDDPWTRKW